MKRIFSATNLLRPIGVLNNLWGKKRPVINLCADEVIRAWLKQYHVPAVGIGLIEDTKLKTIKVYGELSNGVSALHNTIWNVGAMANPVIALTALRLAGRGNLNLDEQLSISPEGTTIRTLVNGPLNDAYVGSILKNKFGKNIQQLCAEELFTPLGMDDSSFTGSEILHSPRFAKPHNNKYGIYVSKYTGKSEANYLMTTVEDYCKFGVYVLKGARLPRKLSHEISLGWNVVKDMPNGEFALTQSAAGNGITAFALLLPNTKRGIVIFTNGDNGKLLEGDILQNSGIGFLTGFTM